MIATVASSSVQYHHTVNTLKYADRAKEIKTHVRQNAGTVQEHIAQYQAIIDDLKEENDQLKRELNTLQVSTALSVHVIECKPVVMGCIAALGDDDQDTSRH